MPVCSRLRLHIQTLLASNLSRLQVKAQMLNCPICILFIEKFNWNAEKCPWFAFKVEIGNECKYFEPFDMLPVWLSPAERVKEMCCAVCSAYEKWNSKGFCLSGLCTNSAWPRHIYRAKIRLLLVATVGKGSGLTAASIFPENPG